MEHNEERRSWPVIYHRDSPNEYIDGLRAALEFLGKADSTTQVSKIKEACVFIEKMREVDTDFLPKDEKERFYDISRQYGKLKIRAKQEAEFELESWCRTTEQYIAEDNISALAPLLKTFTDSIFPVSEASPEVVPKYQDVYARARIMSDFRQSEVGYGWFASNNGTLRLLANEHEVLQLYLNRDAANTHDLLKDIDSVFFGQQNNFGDHENGDWCRQASKIIKELTTTDSYSSMKFILNLVLPLYYHAAKSNQMKDLVDILAKAQPKISGLKDRIAGLNETFCHRLTNSLNGIGLELDPLLFGTAMHFYTDISDDVERLPLTKLPSWIAEHCGNDAESITKYLINKRLNKLTLELSEAVIQHFETEEVRDYYVQIGFLILDSLPLKIIVKPTTIPAVGQPEVGGSKVPDLPKREPEIVASEPLGDPTGGQLPIPENISKPWKDYYLADYRKAHQNPDRWAIIQLDVTRIAEDICTKTQHRKGLKTITLRTLMENEVPENRFIRMLVARRVIIRYFDLVQSRGQNYTQLIRELGFVSNDESDTDGGTAAIQKDNFKNYLSDLGLKKRIIMSPLDTGGLFEEEVNWLKNLYPPS